MRLTESGLNKIRNASTRKLEMMLSQCTERDNHQPSYRNSAVLNAVSDELAARKGNQSLAAASHYFGSLIAH